MGLDNREKRIMAILRDSTAPLGVSSLSDKTGWTDQAHVVGAAMGLTERGLASLSLQDLLTISSGGFKDCRPEREARLSSSAGRALDL